MGNESGKLPSGIDLMKSARNHFEFIQRINFLPNIFHPNVVKHAILRYEKYWLPLAAKFAEEDLVAPIDVDLIWTVHIHNPIAYEKDCFVIAG